ncbi:Gfo/Idh/MocA family protein [Niabella insulamsoli]|uniref:Gfo/Idh/MocA family protein n=1 Tax=Niabella insulamsoli TaxID=3144874 RepID=UPI0031FC0048
MKQKLRAGMIGGGKGAFIGAVHRIALNMDGLIELVCGALSQDPEKAKASGRDLFLPEDRIYESYQEMFKKESALPEDERMQFVIIVTPNFAHFEPAMMALEHGFHVMIDKPMTLTIEEAKLLKDKVDKTGLLLGLTHTYSGYPMVKEARKMVADGKLGPIRKIYVEYPQGWLSQLSESEGNKQAAWRTDPSKSGKAGCMGDIGTHAAHLAEYISGLKITKLCADLNIVVPGRLLDDDGAVLLKFDNGASGVLIASQIAAGEENDLNIRIYGEKGGLKWSQQEPNTLIVRWADAPAQIFRTGNGYLSEVAQLNTRTPGGHPEGYLEAFANLYKNFVMTLAAKLEGTPVDPLLDFPTVEDGVRGMAFIENVVASSKSEKKWWDYVV